MRLPTQSLAVSQSRSFYAPSTKVSSGFIRASLRIGDDMSFPAQGPIYLPEQRPQVAYAQMDFACRDGIYTVSTGNNQGTCTKVQRPDGPSVSCVDSKGGNSADANCASGCLRAQGQGSCTVKA